MTALLRGSSGADGSQVDERADPEKEEYGIDALPRLPFVFGSATSAYGQQTSEVASWFHSSPEKPLDVLEHPGLQVDEVVGGQSSSLSKDRDVLQSMFLPASQEQVLSSSSSSLPVDPSPQQKGTDASSVSPPSFSGKMIVEAPGGSSSQMAEALHGRQTTEPSSFSGVRIVQAPGGSSSRVASYLWGDKEETAHSTTAAVPEMEENVIEEECRSAKELPKESHKGDVAITDPRAAVARITGCDIIKTSEHTASQESLIHDTESRRRQHHRHPLNGSLRHQELERALIRQCNVVEKAALAFMFHEAHVRRHILALKRYMLGAGSAILKEFVVLFQVSYRGHGYHCQSTSSFNSGSCLTYLSVFSLHLLLTGSYQRTRT